MSLSDLAACRHRATLVPSAIISDGSLARIQGGPASTMLQEKRGVDTRGPEVTSENASQ